MKTLTPLVSTVIFATALASQAALVAHYRFDEAANATVAANALGGDAGTVGINVTTGQTGISGNAYLFNSDASVDGIVSMGNASFLQSLGNTNQVTFSAWINTTDTVGNRNVAVFAGNTALQNSYTDMGMAAGIVNPVGQATARNRPTGNGTEIFSGTTLVNDGEWHHLAMTVDPTASLISLYVDGVFASSTTLGVADLPDYNVFEIGRLGRGGSKVDPFQGLIDDVQVYDQVLAPEQIQFLFANPGQAIPEPSALALTGLGFLALIRRKRA